MMEPAHAFTIAYLPATLSIPLAAREVLVTTEKGAARTTDLDAKIAFLSRVYETMASVIARDFERLEGLLRDYGLPVVPRPTTVESAGAWIRQNSLNLIDYIDKRSPEGLAALLGYRLGELVAAMDMVALGRALREVAPNDPFVQEQQDMLEKRLAEAADTAKQLLRGGPLGRFLGTLIDTLPPTGSAAMREHKRLVEEAIEDAMRETRSPDRVASLEESPADTFHLGFLPWSIAVPAYGRQLLADAGEAARDIVAMQEAGFQAAAPGTLLSFQLVEALLRKHGLPVPPGPEAGGPVDDWAEAVRSTVYKAVCGTTPGGASFRSATLFGEAYLCLTLGLLSTLLIGAAPGARMLYERARILAKRVREVASRLEQSARHPRLPPAAREVIAELAGAVRNAPEIDGDDPVHVRMIALERVVSFLTAARDRLAYALGQPPPSSPI